MTDRFEDEARAVAHCLPSSDFGSTRAIRAMAFALRNAERRGMERAEEAVRLAAALDENGYIAEKVAIRAIREVKEKEAGMSDATLTTGVIWPKRDPKLYHVFRLPDELPSGYCFGFGGTQVTMQMVDWFGTSLDWEPSLPEVAEWVRQKIYCKSGAFLVLRNDGQCTIVRAKENL